MANTIACAIVGSRLDYCNSVLAGLSQYNLQRLQRVQNRAAKIMLGLPRRTSSDLALCQLHWLPVAKRIDYKIALIIFKTLSAGQPSYLYSLLTPTSSARTLRSFSQHLFSVPFVKSVISSRAFSVYAPKLWNQLPLSLRVLVKSDSVKGPHDPFANMNLFKTKLKTYLFDAPSSLVT